MKKILIPLFAIIIVMFITSCDVAVERVPLMEYQKQMIPYKMGQKVCFTNEKGDTSCFITQDIITEWQDNSEVLIKLWTQYRKVNLKSESGEQISLQVETLNDGKLTLVINGFHFSLWFDCNGQFYTDFPTRWYVYDSLSVNDKIYYDVVLEDDSQENMQLYYNKTHGILQVRKNGENLLTLQ